MLKAPALVSGGRVRSQCPMRVPCSTGRRRTNPAPAHSFDFKRWCSAAPAEPPRPSSPPPPQPHVTALKRCKPLLERLNAGAVPTALSGAEGRPELSRMTDERQCFGTPDTAKLAPYFGSVIAELVRLAVAWRFVRLPTIVLDLNTGGLDKCGVSSYCIETLAALQAIMGAVFGVTFDDVTMRIVKASDEAASTASCTSHKDTNGYDVRGCFRLEINGCGVPIGGSAGSMKLKLGDEEVEIPIPQGGTYVFDVVKEEGCNAGFIVDHKAVTYTQSKAAAPGQPEDERYLITIVFTSHGKDDDVGATRPWCPRRGAGTPPVAPPPKVAKALDSAVARGASAAAVVSAGLAAMPEPRECEEPIKLEDARARAQCNFHHPSAHAGVASAKARKRKGFPELLPKGARELCNDDFIVVVKTEELYDKAKAKVEAAAAAAVAAAAAEGQPPPVFPTVTRDNAHTFLDSEEVIALAIPLERLWSESAELQVQGSAKGAARNRKRTHPEAELAAVEQQRPPGRRAKRGSRVQAAGSRETAKQQANLESVRGRRKRDRCARDGVEVPPSAAPRQGKFKGTLTAEDEAILRTYVDDISRGADKKPKTSIRKVWRRLDAAAGGKNLWQHGVPRRSKGWLYNGVTNFINAYKNRLWGVGSGGPQSEPAQPTLGACAAGGGGGGGGAAAAAALAQPVASGGASGSTSAAGSGGPQPASVVPAAGASEASSSASGGLQLSPGAGGTSSSSGGARACAGGAVVTAAAPVQLAAGACVAPVAAAVPMRLGSLEAHARSLKKPARLAGLGVRVQLFKAKASSGGGFMAASVSARLAAAPPARPGAAQALLPAAPAPSPVAGGAAAGGGGGGLQPSPGVGGAGSSSGGGGSCAGGGAVVAAAAPVQPVAGACAASLGGGHMSAAAVARLGCLEAPWRRRRRPAAPPSAGGAGSSSVPAVMRGVAVAAGRGQPPGGAAAGGASAVGGGANGGLAVLALVQQAPAPSSAGDSNSGSDGGGPPEGYMEEMWGDAEGASCDVDESSHEYARYLRGKAAARDAMAAEEMRPWRRPRY